MVGRGGGVEEPGQRAQPHAGRLVDGQHGPREPRRAQHRRPRPGLPVPLARGAQEPGVERGVVRHQHRACEELQQRRQHRRERGRARDHRGGDAGEGDDARRHAGARIDERGQLAEPLAAAHLDRADLGDRVARRGAPPVVSRSSTTNVTSRSGVPSSSNDSCGVGVGATAGQASGAPRQESRSAGRTSAGTPEHHERPMGAYPVAMSASHAEPGGHPRRPRWRACVDWAALPDPLRARLADAAATAVGEHGRRRRAARAAAHRRVHPGQAGQARRPGAARRAGGLRGVPGRRRGVVGRAPAR